MFPGSSLPSYETQTEWLRGNGADADVVMSSRVRIARNLAGLPFVARATHVERQHVLDASRSRILACGSRDPLIWVNLHECAQFERTLLVERHLISKQHAKGKPQSEKPGTPKAATRTVDDPRGVAIAVPGERVSIMVNEEDHLRIQVIRSGLALADAWNEIDQLDDNLEAGIDYAFSPRFGYVTACPTNVGTGVRMSVMLHLPALKITGEIEKVKRAASDMNLAVRGFYGEGSDAAGDFYQISNQTTLGKTEGVILHELQNEIIPRVIEYERAARRTLATKRRASLEDQAFRALGVLTNARLLATDETMHMLSHLRLGVVMGIVPSIPVSTVNHLMLLVQPAHLQRVLNTEMDQEQRRAARANLVRARLAAQH